MRKRIEEHNLGLSNFTKSRLPVKLVYFENTADKILAAKREKEIKGWGRVKKLKLINGLPRGTK